MSALFGTISIDLDQLVEKHIVTGDQAADLYKRREKARGTSALINVLYILGALAAAAGVVMLKPTATTGLIIALICLVGGLLVRHKGDADLNILALALGIGSATGLGGWFALEFGEFLPSIVVNGFATGVALAMALIFRSRFLAALVPLGIGAMIGSGGIYWHASYGIFVRESFITVVLFSALAAVFWLVSQRIKHADWMPMAQVASRMSFIVANFGFWVGSLWGDHVGDHVFGPASQSAGQNYKAWKESINAFAESTVFITDNVFAFAWVVFAVGAIVLGRKIGNRFLEIAAIVFLAINAFTQVFEYFENQPWTLVVGGVALVAISLGLVRWKGGENGQTA